MVKVVTQVDSVRPLVYSVLADFARYPVWFPNCEKVVITSVSDDITNLDITMTGMKRITVGLKFECEEDVLIRFEMTRGTEVKAYSGSYRLMNSTDDHGTVMVTEVELDAGAMMPKFMVDRLVKKTLEDNGVALRKYAKTRPAPALAALAEVEEELVAAKPKRARCLLRVVKTDAGEEQVWYGGKIFAPR